MKDKEYYFGIKRNCRDTFAELHIVPIKHWEKHKSKYPGYIPDDELADKLEDNGFIECMENVYEFDTKTMSIEDAINKATSLAKITRNKEFEEFINDN